MAFSFTTLRRSFLRFIPHRLQRRRGNVTLLPPPSNPSRPTVILDLDETLVHAWHAREMIEGRCQWYDFVIEMAVRGCNLNYYVTKRPGVDELLEELAKTFEVVIFTAGIKDYASKVLDVIDPEGTLVHHRLYRDSCRKENGRLVKDLSLLGRDLDRLVIVDDNPRSYMLQPENAVPISPFTGDLADRELYFLKEFFQVALTFEDMREAIKRHYSEAEDEKMPSPMTTLAATAMESDDEEDEEEEHERSETTSTSRSKGKESPWMRVLNKEEDQKGGAHRIS